MLFTIIKIIHLFAAFIYGGFLITDNLFLSRMQKDYTPQEYAKVRESFMQYVRKVVPPSLVVILITGLYLFSQTFGTIGPDGMSRYQILLSIKAILGVWLAMRGVLQVYFGIQPFVFKSHRLPFILVILIILLSQLIHI